MERLLRAHLGMAAAVAAVVVLAAPSAWAVAPTDMSVKVTNASFRVGRQGRYTITVANRGNQTTDDEVHLQVTLPAGVSFVSSSGAAWACAASGQSVDCTAQRSLGAGRTSTFRMRVAVCTDAFPGVVTTFRVAYAGEINLANDIATRSTVVRQGQCAVGTPTPRNTPAATAPQGTPAPGSPTRSPTPGSATAPVVTSFTCNGSTQCEVSIGESFALRFSFSDADGNAISWRITARRDDGFTTEAGRGSLGTPTANATIPLQFPGFTCPQGPCRRSTFDFSVTATDTTGQTSPPLSIVVTVRSSGQ
jgi:uncharacterized repeat protein (TIGR01451 family)